MQHLESVSRAAADVYAVLTFGPFMLLELTRLSGRVKSPFNVTVSNAPGRKELHYLLGAAREGVYMGLNPGHGQRLHMCVSFADGRFGVTFTGCGDSLGDVHQLTGLLAEAVSELESALGIPDSGAGPDN
jgi:hypothetical protein